MSRGTPHAGDDPHGDEEPVAAGTPVAEADAAVVLVHGRGATARSIVGFGEEVSPPDGNVALLAPQAAANTWYPNSFLASVDDNEPGRTSGLRAVGDAVERATDAGIDAGRVLVAGFSQGACLASEFVARNPREYGGLAALSGGLIGESIDVDDYVADAVAEGGDATPEDALAGTPAFLGCSDVDPHIPEERVHETAEVLEALGGDVETRIYEGMGHGINADETERVSEMVAALA
ncbi:phospholipase/carboxylesterase [Halorubrum aquaticum]|uniref:Phospholipase/carboxylesterase n=1 Tax=Halorubrum aquaticum TaxID=387340 RepID=A0A1I3CSJ1_9EURY|nr:dienelactone hydrolase family protein [Halorubrum aquaticum]SFH77229.1 phospholipase/carboxylesterase [Halorubrum aquaticum]